MLRTATCFLIAFLSLPSLGQGQVLCIGVDGHVALESAFNGKCCDAPQPTRSDGWPVVSGPLTDLSDCGLCADILVGGAANADRMARPKSSASPAFVLPLVAVLDRALGLPPIPASHPPRQAAPQNSPLSHIRTVSLLV